MTEPLTLAQNAMLRRLDWTTVTTCQQRTSGMTACSDRATYRLRCQRCPQGIDLCARHGVPFASFRSVWKQPGASLCSLCGLSGTFRAVFTLEPLAVPA